VKSLVLLCVSLTLTPDERIGIAALIMAAFMFCWSWLMYDKGLRDERFRQNYLCVDCGDFREDQTELQCRDCQRKMWGEMTQ
jgi:hypothetical protein